MKRSKGTKKKTPKTHGKERKEKQPKKKHSLQPENAGKRWTDEEDKKLSEMFDAGISKKEICNTFKRTSTGIASRLVRLGKITERDEFRNRR